MPNRSVLQSLAAITAAHFPVALDVGPQVADGELVIPYLGFVGPDLRAAGVMPPVPGKPVLVLAQAPFQLLQLAFVGADVTPAAGLGVRQRSYRQETCKCQQQAFAHMPPNQNKLYWL